MGSWKRLLVANRGEIACRVLRGARALGYETVAVYSEADRDAPHVGQADQAICIGPAPAPSSYLDAARILDGAQRTGADAIHPGYGFLSENADFARACAEAGVVFVGPSADAIEAMGDKGRAKELMREAGVPCIPGGILPDEDDLSSDVLQSAGDEVGYPLLVKAIQGGGGRGMRRVDDGAGLQGAVTTARSEAQSAFGSGAVMLERLIENARHVEIQVMADQHGQVIHLGERDCSAQRRHQKIIEEAPCPAVDADLRERMGQAAVEAARAVDYVGAGTVEFLLGPDGAFYFLEMNTRLQVEHPVTECVTGLDLVALQLRVAAGEPLGFEQGDVSMSGHAIEARLYAEDPSLGFLPQTGRVVAWRAPKGAGIRCDHGLSAGMSIEPFYDAMVAKIIAHGPDRASARRRLERALADTVLLGVTHNGAFLRHVLSHPTFIAGEMTTSFVEERLAADSAATDGPGRRDFAVAAALWMDRRGTTDLGGWRSTGRASTHLRLEASGEVRAIRATFGDRGCLWISADNEEAVEVRRLGSAGPLHRVEVDGVQTTVHGAWSEDRDTLYVRVDDATHAFQEQRPGGASGARVADGDVRSPMSGRILKVHVADGDAVTAGQVLITLEAMKLETALESPMDGRVVKVAVQVGDLVAGRQLLVSVEANSDHKE